MNVVRLGFAVATLASAGFAQAQPPCREFFSQWNSTYLVMYHQFNWHSTELRWYQYFEPVPTGTGLGAIVMWWADSRQGWYGEQKVILQPRAECEPRALNVHAFWWNDSSNFPQPGDRLGYLGFDIDLVRVPSGIAFLPPVRASYEPFCWRTWSGNNSEAIRPYYWALLLVPEGAGW